MAYSRYARGMVRQRNVSIPGDFGVEQRLLEFRAKVKMWALRDVPRHLQYSNVHIHIRNTAITQKFFKEAVESESELSSKDPFNRGTNTLRYLQE